MDMICSISVIDLWCWNLWVGVFELYSLSVSTLHGRQLPQSPQPLPPWRHLHQPSHTWPRLVQLEGESRVWDTQRSHKNKENKRPVTALIPGLNLNHTTCTDLAGCSPESRRWAAAAGKPALWEYSAPPSPSGPCWKKNMILPIIN